VSETPADPVTTEDGLYTAIVDEYQGLRRAGAGIVAAAAISAAHLMYVQKSGEA
jgi:hypothetical protein